MATIRKGSSGSDVKKAQELLKKKGYDIGSKTGVDGKFGAKTEEATKKFQKANKLVVDGIIGDKTWGKLNPKTPPSTAHFKFSEFACHDKARTPVPEKYWDNLQKLMNALEKLRKVWNKPITINSGYRTEAHNRSVGGSSNSQHLYASAADIVVQGVGASTVYSKANSLFPKDGVGKYKNFTHIDVRGYKSRWEG